MGEDRTASSRTHRQQHQEPLLFDVKEGTPQAQQSHHGYQIQRGLQGVQRQYSLKAYHCRLG